MVQNEPAKSSKRTFGAIFVRFPPEVYLYVIITLWGDVVLDSFSNASRDEDYILDKIYKNQKCSDFYYDDFKSYDNAYKHWSNTKTQLYDFLVVECCISLNMHFLQSLLEF